MTKTLNQIIFFFLHQNQNIFFSNIGNQNIFLEKNHNPPLQVKWSVPNAICKNLPSSGTKMASNYKVHSPHGKDLTEHVKGEFTNH
jgi:hypothetical protein